MPRYEILIPVRTPAESLLSDRVQSSTGGTGFSEEIDESSMHLTGNPVD